MHVLYIYKDYPPILGGIEVHVRDLAEGMVARGHQATVLVTNTINRTIVEHPVPGLTIIRAARIAHAASTPLSPAMLIWARRLRPDVVHMQFPYPPGDLAALAVPGHPPLIVSYQSDIVRQRTLLLAYQPLLQHTLKRAARIITSSPNYMQTSPFLRPHAGKCVVISPAVDVERFNGNSTARAQDWRERYVAPGQTAILFVGRLRYYKGLHFLIEAMPRIDQQTILLIGGDGPERTNLEQLALRYGVRERIHFLGEIPEPELAALYHAADLFVLPSHLRAEAFGIVQTEALASGLPIISTELGTGTSYVNLNQQTGLIVPPADPEALALAINMLAADPDLRRSYGEAGRQRARALFSIPVMLEKVEQLYRTVLGSAR
jgi:rhamnosyl/mannosyltransferase